MIRLALLLVLLMAVAGCVTRSLDAQRFHSLTERYGMGHLYYTGTKGGFHYFTERYFLQPTHHYQLPVAAYPIKNTIPKTSDRALWIPWLFDLNANTKGFRGEATQPIR